MKIETILSRYERLSKRYQLNLSSFRGMKSELIAYCLRKGLNEEKQAIERICEGYLHMRDGCEINSTTFKDAIKEINSAVFAYKK